MTLTILHRTIRVLDPHVHKGIGDSERGNVRETIAGPDTDAFAKPKVSGELMAHTFGQFTNVGVSKRRS